MELRSYNVERVYKESVKCTIGDDLITNKDYLEANIPNIKSMLSQIETSNGYVHFCACNRRKDGEYWTTVMQIIEMLIRLGCRIGCVKYTGPLKMDTLLKIENL